MKSRTFDTSTLAGIKSAERYKTQLEGQFDKVTVTILGLDKVKIWATR